MPTQMGTLHYRHVHILDEENITFSDADNERDLRLKGLEDGGSGAGGRDVDDSGIGLDLSSGLSHGVEHG